MRRFKETLRMNRDMVNELSSELGIPEEKIPVLAEKLVSNPKSREIIIESLGKFFGRRSFLEYLAAGAGAMVGATAVAGAKTLITDQNVIIDDQWFLKTPMPYSAIVYIDNGRVYAEDWRGKEIAKGTAGVDDAAVIQSAANNIDSYQILKIVGGYTIDSTITIQNKPYITIDARSARFNIASGVVGFDINNCDTSEFLIGLLSGSNKTGTGFKISEGDVVKLDIRRAQELEKGVHITNVIGNTLDNDIFFGQIGVCKYGIYIDGSNVQGLRVQGNFINNVDVAGIYINSSGFWWNYFDIVAIDPAGGQYSFYATGSGYGNRCRISGFLSGASVYDIYEDMGRWWFEVPETWSYKYSIALNSVLEQKIPYGIKEIDGVLNFRNLFTYPLKIITVNNASSELTLTGCSLTDNGDGTFRLSSNLADWYVEFPLNISGSIVRWVAFKYKYVSGGLTSNAVYYATGTHGYSQSYYKTIKPYIADGRWHLQWLDMWDLTAGGTDWKDNIINKVRIDFTANADTVMDIAFIGLFGETPMLKTNSGTATISADGVATQFTIPHGLVSAPSFVSVQPKAGAPVPDSIDWDATNIILTFSAAPAAGTYYYAWKAEV